MNEPDVTRAQREIRNPEVTYDPTDLSARAVVLFLIFLAIGGIFVITLLWGVYKYLAADRFMPHPTTQPIGTSKQQRVDLGGDRAAKFPAPRLQPDPVADLNKFRVREQEILNTYGWVDQANGKVHIPIERAIDLTAAAGLPVRPNTPLPAKPIPGAPGVAGEINVQQGEGKLSPPQQ